MSTALLLFLLLSVAAVRIAHTVLRVSRWPIAAYDLFCEVFPNDLHLYTIVLDDCHGRQYSALPGQVVPIEYFRTNGLIGNVYVRSSDTARKHRLALLLLSRLNEQPWSVFDEVAPSIRPLPGRRFVRLRIYSSYFQFDRLAISAPISDQGVPVQVIFDSYATEPLAP